MLRPGRPPARLRSVVVSVCTPTGLLHSFHPVTQCLVERGRAVRSGCRLCRDAVNIFPHTICFRQSWSTSELESLNGFIHSFLCLTLAAVAFPLALIASPAMVRTQYAICFILLVLFLLLGSLLHDLERLLIVSDWAISHLAVLLTSLILLRECGRLQNQRVARVLEVIESNGVPVLCVKALLCLTSLHEGRWFGSYILFSDQRVIS